MADGVQVPVQRLDHYTLITSDAAAAKDFHINALNYTFVRKQEVNTGTVGPDESDMLNYILLPPSNPDVILVITEGLNDRTVFRQHMKKFGPGVHHIAFSTNNIKQEFQRLRAAGVKTTRDTMTRDPLTGLLQFFIDPCYTGFVIELIERAATAGSDKAADKAPDSAVHVADENTFTKHNMSDLALSIQSHVVDENHDVGNDPVSKAARSSETDALQGVDLQKCTSDLVEGMKGVNIGKIVAMEICVSDHTQAVEFLVSMLSLKVVREDTEQGTIFLEIPEVLDTAAGLADASGQPSPEKTGILLAVKQAPSSKEERNVKVFFDMGQEDLRKLQALPSAEAIFDLKGPKDSTASGQTLQLAQHFSQGTVYTVCFSTPQAISAMRHG